MPIIVSFSAKAGRGKDTCARLLRELLRAEHGLLFGNFCPGDILKARVYGELRGEVSYEEVFHTKPPIVRERLQRAGTEEGRELYGEDIWTLQLEALMRRLAESCDFIDGWTVTDARFWNEIAFALGGGEAEITQMRVAHERTQAALTSLVCPPGGEDFLRLEAGVYEVELATRPPAGVVVWIDSDRPTLTGEAALHPSETQFDEADKDEAFDFRITNDLSTTLDDLREQLRPIAAHVAHLVAETRRGGAD